MQLSSFLKVGQRVWRNWFVKSTQPWWKKIVAGASPEYERWRHRFIIKRLYLMTWIAIVVMSISQIINWLIPFTSLDPSSPEYNFYLQNLEVVRLIRIIGWIQILFTFVLLKAPYTRKHPILIQLWLTWTLLVSYQVILIISLGILSIDGYDWIVVLSAGPILMPVRWRWHCLCQLFFFGYLAISSFVFGFHDPFVNGIEYFNAVYITAIVCFIVNYAVFLYEKFLQQEFELQRQFKLFLHTVSHDLRSPVLGTMFLLKSLRNPIAKETTIANEILDRIVDSSDRQLQLIDSLLEAHATETKGIAIHPRPVYIDSLVESVISEMQPLLARQRVTTTTKISAKLPLVNIDPLQVRRVYENLITNALEYNRAGLHLTFKVEKDYSLYDKQTHTESDRWIYCTISDNGEGIPLQQHSQLFNLYTRASSSKQSLGVGLGLYICRQIINAHGGQIDINRTQKGASFWFTLPIVKSDV